MSPASSLRLLPYDYDRLSRSVAVAERSTMLMSTRIRWAPCERTPIVRREDDPWEMSDQAREVARMELERLWDEMETLGLFFTGEVVHDTMFPFLAASWHPCPALG